jgi:hypothetical protein
VVNHSKAVDTERPRPTRESVLRGPLSTSHSGLPISRAGFLVGVLPHPRDGLRDGAHAVDQVVQVGVLYAVRLRLTPRRARLTSRMRVAVPLAAFGVLGDAAHQRLQRVAR